MNFTINEFDQVIERTGCSYEEAKEALLQTDGDVVDAIILLEGEAEKDIGSRIRDFMEDSEKSAESVIEKIKEAIRKGSVSKIVVRNSEGKDVTSVSVNTGVAIGGFALMINALPLAIISGLVAKYGLKYQFVVVDEDGSEKIF